MRKLYIILLAVLFIGSALAQTPSKISYQAVIRNSSNQLLINQVVGMKISILQGSSSGIVVYTETQTPTTNANGLVTIEIGGGPGFNAINWAASSYFIKTETDPAGGTNYTIAGTSQLLSVPYALNAKSAESITGTINETDPIFSGSQAANITSSHITKLSYLSGTNTGDQDLSGKVDKITGKGLSTNDYTTSEKTKVSNLSGTNTGDQDLSGLATTSSVNTLLNSKVDKEAGKGLSTNDYTSTDQLKVFNLSGTNTGDQDLSGLATTSSVNILLNLKVDKEAGKGLSTNDYTTAEKIKVSNLAGTNTGDQDLSALATTSSVNTKLNLKVDKEAGKGLSTKDYTSADQLKVLSLLGTNTGDETSETIKTKLGITTLSGINTGDQNGSETKVTAGTNVTVSGSGTIANPYVINAATSVLTIGSVYQGGIIFWLDSSGKHGLIAATVDQGTNVKWDDGNSGVTNAVRDGINAGMYNTERIINIYPAANHAAQLCANYKGGGYGDWYLPSKYELNLLYLKKASVLGFTGTEYASSTEANYNSVWVQNFGTGTQSGGPSNKVVSTFSVRAIRAF